jgi:hypothetical protein
MSKTITKEWLHEKRACAEGYDWFIRQRARDEVKVLEHLIKDEKFDWAIWLIVRRMTRKQYLQYAVFAAEQVIDIFEKKYPNDKRPREAITAARKCIEDDTQENRAAADAAADAADAAAYADAYAADAAAVAAYAADARKEMRTRILTYGISLMKG